MKNKFLGTISIYLLLILFSFASAIFSDSIFNFKSGGTIMDWYRVGPIATSDTSIDFLKKLPGNGQKTIDSKSVIKVTTDTSFKAYYSDYIKSDTSGILNILDTLNAPTVSVLYLGASIKTFTTETVRFFFSSNARVKLIIDGIEITSGTKRYDFRFPGKIFDLKLKQGLIPVTVKVINPQKGDQLSLWLYPVADSLKIFENHINSIKLSSHYNSEKSSLIFNYSYNISTDSTIFGAVASLSSTQRDATPILLSSNIKANKKYEIKIPQSLSDDNFLNINLSSNVGNKTIVEESYFSIKNVDSLQAVIFSTLKQLNYSKSSSLIKFIVEGFKSWSNQYLSKVDSYSKSERIRALALIDNTLRDMNFLIHKSKVPKSGFIVPLRITSSILDNTPTVADSEYDNCRWLNYKYPKEYSIIPTEEYDAFIFVPYVAKRKKNIPVTLLLHSSIESSIPFMDMVDYPYLNFAKNSKKFPSVVIMPHLDTNSIWDAGMIGKLMNSIGKFSDVDIRRINIVGEEMGGFEAFNIAHCFPNIISAVAVLNAFGNSDQIASLKDIPITFVYGSDNTIIPALNVKKSVNQLKIEGNRRTKFIVLSAGGDSIANIVFKMPEFFRKFYKNKK